ncbi:MAG TPA: hypothetical protein VFX48_04625, partial [Saprospiraceae bacterium]|nr:hypothetical protein [Saprospiraceae bacterium]
KTINLPEAASISDVDAIYRMAWKMKAKGITIFRNQYRGEQILNPGIRYGNKGCKVCLQA